MFLIIELYNLYTIKGLNIRELKWFGGLTLANRDIIYTRNNDKITYLQTMIIWNLQSLNKINNSGS